MFIRSRRPSRLAAGLLAAGFLLPAGSILMDQPPALAETIAEAAAWAVQRHPTLQADLATVRSAEENVVTGRSDFFPVLSLVGEMNVDNYQRTNGPLDLWGREVGVRANQLIYDGSGAFAKVDALVAEREALLADRNRNGNTVAYGAARAYLLVLRDRELSAAAQRNLDEHRRSVTRLAAIVKYDPGKGFDLAQVQAREAFAASMVAERAALLQADEAAYLELVGQPAGQLVAPSPLSGPGFASLDDALAVAQVQHPAVVAAGRRREGARARIRQNEAGLLPRIYLTGRYDTGLDRQGVRGWNTEGFLGVKASYTYGAQSTAGVKVAREQEDVAASRVEAARRDVREAVRVAWEQRAGMIADLPPAEEALRQSLLVLEGFKTQYTFGRRTALDLLIVQNDAYRAEARAVGLRYDRLMADYALAAQLGVLEARLSAAPQAPRQTETPVAVRQ
jgi:outer membrane protein TolC